MSPAFMPWPRGSPGRTCRMLPRRTAIPYPSSPPSSAVRGDPNRRVSGGCRPLRIVPGASGHRRGGLPGSQGGSAQGEPPRAGRPVRQSEKRGLPLAKPPIGAFQQAHRPFEEDVRGVFSSEASGESRAAHGGTAKGAVEEQIRRAERALSVQEPGSALSRLLHFHRSYSLTIPRMVRFPQTCPGDHEWLHETLLKRGRERPASEPPNPFPPT